MFPNLASAFRVGPSTDASETCNSKVLFSDGFFNGASTILWYIEFLGSLFWPASTQRYAFIRFSHISLGLGVLQSSE